MPRRMFVRLIATWLGLFAAQLACAQSFNYIGAQDLMKQMDAGKSPLIVDVQSERDYSRGHLPGAIATKAYPVSTSMQRDRLKPVVAQILGTSKDVVIVCPGGAEAAESAYNYLKERGVPEQRLAILKGGQSKWPYFNVIREK